MGDRGTQVSRPREEKKRRKPVRGKSSENAEEQ